MKGFYLLLGDCLEQMKRLPVGCVDLVLSDPPYGTTACKWDAIIPFAPMWEQIHRVAKLNAATVMTATQPFTSALGASNIEELKYSWCWEKSRATGHLNAKKHPMKVFEDILVFYSVRPTYNPQGLVHSPRRVMNSKSHSLRGKGTETSTVSGGIRYEEYTQEFTNYPRNILRIASEGNTIHPTQKPIKLMEYLIKTYTRESQVVLDFTMGSGTTGIACANTGRKFIGIEKDEKYFELAKGRIEAAFSSLQEDK